MRAFIPAPEPITQEWLTAVLRQSGALTQGQVLAVESKLSAAFNSQTRYLRLRYSRDEAPDLPTRMILKRNIQQPWAIEAGAEEVKFYQTIAGLQPPPPGIVACYAAAYDPGSGNSYLLFQDLSQTHTPPITREQQISIVEGVPQANAIDRVVDALAHHHAYWWNHSLLKTDSFAIGYWSRDTERFAQYLNRRNNAWADLVANEATWFPDALRQWYDRVLAALQRYWETYLAPRFRAHTNLTLVHGDAYFANFLCPKDPAAGTTYLLDWQSPTFDIGGYDLANLCATFWTSAQRGEEQREMKILQRYHATLQASGVTAYSWDDLIADYQAGLIYWLLVPIQDRYGGSGSDYWWPKMQCLVAAFREWRCEELLGLD